MELVLYGRPDCCLCDRLEALVAEHLLQSRSRTTVTWTKCNVDDDAHWQTLYGSRIPVLTHGQHVILEGNPEPDAIAAAISELFTI